MTDEKKKGTRFTFIDALLILVVMALAAFVCLYFINQNKSSTEIEGNVRYALKINYLDNDSTAKLAAGDMLYDKSGTVFIGKIKSITTVPSVYSYIPEGSRESETAYYPDKSDITVLVEIYAQSNGIKYEADDFEFYVGKEIEFRTKKISLFGKCIAVFHDDQTTTSQDTTSPTETTTSSTPSSLEQTTSSEETTTTADSTTLSSIEETTTSPLSSAA